MRRLIDCAYAFPGWPTTAAHQENISDATRRPSISTKMHRFHDNSWHLSTNHDQTSRKRWERMGDDSSILGISFAPRLAHGSVGNAPISTIDFDTARGRDEIAHGHRRRRDAKKHGAQRTYCAGAVAISGSQRMPCPSRTSSYTSAVFSLSNHTPQILSSHVQGPSRSAYAGSRKFYLRALCEELSGTL